MINLACSKPTKRLSATLSALAVFSFGPQLVVQRKVLPPKSPEQVARPTDAIRPASIGSISGTVSWKVGQLTIPSPATDSSIQQVLGLHAVISDNTPAAAAQAAPFQAQKNLPNLPRYGPMTTVGSVVSVPYTISGLPQGIAIRIDAAPSIMFENSIPVPVKCSMASGLEVKNYNFKCTVILLEDKAGGASAGSSGVIQRKASSDPASENMALPSIGSISGMVSWKVGQVTIPAPATDSSIQQVLRLHAVVADHSPAAGAQAAPFQAQKNLPNLPRYGPMTTVGDIVHVSYTISGLPQGTAIRVDAAPSIMFENSIPIPVRCDMSSGLDIKNYNFRYQVLLLEDKTVGSSGNSSNTRQRMEGYNPASDKRVLPSIGTISGTVSWKVGEIPAPKMILMGSDSTQSMLALAAWIETSPQGAPGEITFHGQKKVGTAPKYGQVTTAGGVVSVPYTIYGLPQGVSIRVDSESPANTFESSMPGGAKLFGPSGLDVKNYNLSFKKAVPVLVN